jgi:hypothetical protein
VGTLERQPSALGGDKTIFQGMGNAYGGLQITNPGGPLEGVSCAHKSFETPSVGIAFEFQQSCSQQSRLIFNLCAKEIEH